MSTKDFIARISEELKERVEFRPNPNKPGLAGLYYEGVYICAVPEFEIFEDFRPGYSITLGERDYAHPNMEQTKAKVENFINRWKNEEGFKELMTESI